MAEIAAITPQLRAGSIDFRYLDKAGIIPIPFTSPQRSLSILKRNTTNVKDFARPSITSQKPRRSHAARALAALSINVESLTA